MALELALACVLAAVLMLGARRWLAGRSAGWARLPGELRRAELIYSERLFRVDDPEAISAKVDRAYRRRDGVVVLLELKTRVHARVYPSDVIELSACAADARAGSGVAREAPQAAAGRDHRAACERRAALVRRLRHEATRPVHAGLDASVFSHGSSHLH